MQKNDVVDELRAARTELMAALEGLTPEQMRMAGAVGIWSVKDVLAHLTAWESELVTALNQATKKRAPQIVLIDDLDEWNAKQYHISAARSAESILVDFESVHNILCNMVAGYNEQALFDRLRYPWMEGEHLVFLIEENATLHEQEHTEDILAWRRERGI